MGGIFSSLLQMSQATPGKMREIISYFIFHQEVRLCDIDIFNMSFLIWICGICAMMGRNWNLPKSISVVYLSLSSPTWWIPYDFWILWIDILGTLLCIVSFHPYWRMPQWAHARGTGAPRPLGLSLPAGAALHQPRWFFHDSFFPLCIHHQLTVSLSFSARRQASINVKFRVQN